jgi:hypothetical protein
MNKLQRNRQKLINCIALISLVIRHNEGGVLFFLHWFFYRLRGTPTGAESPPPLLQKQLAAFIGRRCWELGSSTTAAGMQ